MDIKEIKSGCFLWRLVDALPELQSPDITPAEFIRILSEFKGKPIDDNRYTSWKNGTFPVKYLGFSPCFRREAGSHGKDVKGLIRVNEFYKLEQVVLCEANHEVSVKFHEEINKNTEEFIESLRIPYRTVINCGADLGLGQVKKYDVELWVPKEKKYREISSASYFHDFQCRRFNIRYKGPDGKTRYAHSLNNTAIPTPRILVSLVENNQQADGSIRVPEVLQKYFGREIIK